MFQRGVRGAITVESNTSDAIKDATLELLNEILIQNDIKTKDIAFVIFTLTKDLNAAFPAKFAREAMSLKFDFKYVPMMCYNEADIEGSIKMCLRVLLNINTSKEQNEIKHVYLKGAKALRQDLNT